MQNLKGGRRSDGPPLKTSIALVFTTPLHQIAMSDTTLDADIAAATTFPAELVSEEPVFGAAWRAEAAKQGDLVHSLGAEAHVRGDSSFPPRFRLYTSIIRAGRSVSHRARAARVDSCQ